MMDNKSINSLRIFLKTLNTYFFIRKPYQLYLKVNSALPNQELSGAKSELQRGMVGVCLSHKRGGQPPNSLAHLCFTQRSLQVRLLALKREVPTNKKYE